ncbi:MAG TPA: CARDB domain-containing protein [Candidatus Paceibacterota bacterium]
MTDTVQNPPDGQPAQRRMRGTLAHTLAILGFTILAIIIVWGLASLALSSSPWFSSLFDGTKDTLIEIEAPSEVRSTIPFTVTWKYENNDDGTFAFLFECREGLQMGVPAQTNSYAAVPCATAVTLPEAATSLTILPILAATSTADTTISILFMPTDGSAASPEASGSTTIKIIPSVPPRETVPQPEPQPAPKPTVRPTPPVPAATPADLTVTLMSVEVDAYGNATAVFDIANRGGTATGVYYFTASLPMQSAYMYTSPAQASLSPSSHILSTLRFSQAVGGSFSVTVDGANAVRESNESNNSASQIVYAPASYNQTYTPPSHYSPYSY